MKWSRSDASTSRILPLQNRTRFDHSEREVKVFGGGLTVIKAMACKKSEGEDFELNSKWRRLGICDHCWKMWFGWPGANMQMHIEKEAACFLAASIARATGTTGDDEKP